MILNIDITEDNAINIQGFFVFPKQGNAAAFGKYRSFIPLTESPQRIRYLLDEAQIKPLFKYSGERWLGARRN